MANGRRLKRFFIKIFRKFGFEIIDQANFSSPTLEKNLDETLSIQGKKSITIPLGQINIKRKIKSVTTDCIWWFIIFIL